MFGFCNYFVMYFVFSRTILLCVAICKCLDVRFLFAYPVDMETRRQLMLLPTRSSAGVTRRVRYYTRKLAEIERFIERQGLPLEGLIEHSVTVHRYWQGQA